MTFETLNISSALRFIDPTSGFQVSSVGYNNFEQISRTESFGAMNDSLEIANMHIKRIIALQNKAANNLKTINEFKKIESPLTDEQQLMLLKEHQELGECKLEEWARLVAISKWMNIDFFAYPHADQIFLLNDKITTHLRTTEKIFQIHEIKSYQHKHCSFNINIQRFLANLEKNTWMRFFDCLMSNSKNNQNRIFYWLGNCNDEQWHWFKNIVKKQSSENLQCLVNDEAEGIQLIKVALNKNCDDLCDLLLSHVKKSPLVQKIIDELLQHVLLGMPEKNTQRMIYWVENLLALGANPSTLVDHRPCLEQFIGSLGRHRNFEVIKLCIEAGFTPEENLLKNLLYSSRMFCANQSDALLICSIMKTIFNRLIESSPGESVAIATNKLEYLDLTSENSIHYGVKETLLIMLRYSASGKLATLLAEKLPDETLRRPGDRETLIQLSRNITQLKSLPFYSHYSKQMTDFLEAVLWRYSLIHTSNFLEYANNLISAVKILSENSIFPPYTSSLLSLIQASNHDPRIKQSIDFLLEAINNNPKKNDNTSSIAEKFDYRSHVFFELLHEADFSTLQSTLTFVDKNEFPASYDLSSGDQIKQHVESLESQLSESLERLQSKSSSCSGHISVATLQNLIFVVDRLVQLFECCRSREQFKHAVSTFTNVPFLEKFPFIRQTFEQIIQTLYVRNHGITGIKSTMDIVFYALEDSTLWEKKPNFSKNDFLPNRNLNLQINEFANHLKRNDSILKKIIREIEDLQPTVYYVEEA